MKKNLLTMAALLAMGVALYVTTSCNSRQKAIAKHVIIIGLDGWGSYSMDSAQAPNIRQYMAEGCYTLFKRTIRPSVSGPNWAAQMNGTPLESTGYTQNSPEPTFKPLFLTEHNEQPTFFHLMRQQYPDAETGVVCEWGDFLNYADTLCLSYFKRIDDPSENPESIVEESTKYIKEKKPALLFIHIDALDHAGHSFGRGTPEYYQALEHADGQIAQIVEAIKEAGIYDDSVIILTSDHGHDGTGHGGDSLYEIETPFVIWGKGIKKGEEITETMIQYDVAATVAKILNLQTPQSWRGVSMNVFK